MLGRGSLGDPSRLPAGPAAVAVCGPDGPALGVEAALGEMSGSALDGAALDDDAEGATGQRPSASVLGPEGCATLGVLRRGCSALRGLHA
jgi:hypothetical protein